MDYVSLAKELFFVRTRLNHLPVGEAMIKLSEGEYSVLSFLLSNESFAHPSQLSRHLSVSTARIAALLNRLEKKGLVRRSCDPSDERKIIVTLTESGASCVSSGIENAIDGLSKLLEALGEKDAEEYLRIQKKLLSAADKNSNRGVESNQKISDT